MYESHFGLSERPFKLSPDPRYFYASPQHEKAISYLKYGLEQGEGFIVITGPIGTGKTIIAHSLLSSIDESIKAIQIATTKLSPEDLVRLIAEKLGIHTEERTKAEILSSIETYLLNLNKTDRRVLLIVDEAQNLPADTIEELRMLSNFQFNDQPLIQSFLLGQEELKDIILLPQMEQFRQRIIASCHLTTLNESQTKEYILHRLHQAGWEGTPSFTDDVFSIISEKTKGVPRKINVLSDRLCLYAYLENLSLIDSNHINDVVDEMYDEFSASLESPSLASASENNFQPGGIDSEDIEHVHFALRKVQEILDSVIAEKINKVKELEDKIEAKKQLLCSDNLEEY